MNAKKKFNITTYLQKNNFKRFSLFIVIAFIFLIFSKLSNDYKQSIVLKINIENLDDEIIIENDSLNTISAFIEAKGFAFIPLIFNGVKQIDLNVNTDVKTTTTHYIFDAQKHKFLLQKQLGSSYKIISLQPDTLAVSYSQRASKMVPVRLKTKINYALGYDVKGKFKTDIDSVKVVGSEVEIEKINEIETETLVLEDLNTNIDEIVNLNVSNYNKIDIFPKKVNIQATVTRFTEGTIDIPISVTNKPNSVKINYFPKAVTIAYYVDLENYKSINASDFIVECNYADLEEDQTYFIPKIVEKPEFVKRVTIKQNRIDFIKL